MHDEVLIQVESTCKKFCRDLRRSLWYGTNDILREILGSDGSRQQHLSTKEFWAVYDVSFELRRGECLGLIGRNGAGKTTLLKLLNGLIKPDKGRILLRGRVGALIALGAGFNPVLTGRENVYINGAVLGIPKSDIDRKLDEIIAFAELEEFIDTPVQSYSSGMIVRLGFSVATALRPDVLFIDEVLAVGDAAFRSKCYSRLAELRDSTAVILVSHNMQAVANIADRVLLLDKGSVAYSGEPSIGISRYEELNHGDTPRGFLSLNDPVIALSHSWDKDEVLFDDSLSGWVAIDCKSVIENAVVRIVIYDGAGLQVAELGSEFIGQEIRLEPGTNELRVQIDRLCLKAGNYWVSICVSRNSGLAIIAWDHFNSCIRIRGSRAGFGGYQLKGAIGAVAK